MHSVRIPPHVLQPLHELVGILEVAEPVGGGLVKVRIAGLERLVSDELEGRLGALEGKEVSILRTMKGWTAVEWKGWKL